MKNVHLYYGPQMHELHVNNGYVGEPERIGTKAFRRLYVTKKVKEMKVCCPWVQSMRRNEPMVYDEFKEGLRTASNVFFTRLLATFSYWLRACEGPNGRRRRRCEQCTKSFRSIYGPASLLYRHIRPNRLPRRRSFCGHR